MPRSKYSARLLESNEPMLATNIPDESWRESPLAVGRISNNLHEHMNFRTNPNLVARAIIFLRCGATLCL